ncbi:MAG: TetR/AcrR family transcriptional regulator [Hyphomonadaceae bacterium]
MTRKAKAQPRQRNAQSTQRALLEGGAQLFAERGYEAVTLEAIAESAGVTKAMVRYHFGDKAGFYRAVISESLDHIVSAIRPVRDASLTADAKLTRYVAALAEGIRARPHLGGLLISDYAAGRIAKDPFLSRSLVRLFETTKAILDEGVRAGEFRKLDPHLFHLWLVGAIVLFVSSQRFRDDAGAAAPYTGPAPRFDRFVRMLQHLALKGVAPD